MKLTMPPTVAAAMAVTPTLTSSATRYTLTTCWPMLAKNIALKSIQNGTERRSCASVQDGAWCSTATAWDALAWPVEGALGIGGAERCQQLRGISRTMTLLPSHTKAERQP